MTLEQYNELKGASDEGALDRFNLHFEERSVNFDQGAVDVYVERSLLRDDDGEVAANAWVRNNAEAAIRTNAVGDVRVNGGRLGSRWTWVIRLFTDGGEVVLLNGNK